MRIGEVARQTGLSVSRIRFYEAKGLAPKAERRENGYRDYPDDVVELLCLIRDAQELGFSLGEIKAGLAQAGTLHPPKREILTALLGKLASLDQHIQEVTARRGRIVDLIAHIRAECEGMELEQAC